MARYNRIKCELPMPLKINEINSIAHQVLCMHDRQTERTQKKRECYTEHSTTSNCLGLHSSTERRRQGCPDHTLCTHPERRQQGCPDHTPLQWMLHNVALGAFRPPAHPQNQLTHSVSLTRN